MSTDTSNKVTGKQLVDFLNKYNGRKYKLGVLVPKADRNYSGSFDCAEFASYGVYQLGGFLYGCVNNAGNPNSADAYTGFWSRDAHKIGKIISVEEAIKTKGAFLLRVAGNGVIGHIVCSQGDGTTIEANSTKFGVGNFKTTGRRFDFGIILSQFDYSVNDKIDLPKVNTKPKSTVFRFTTPRMVDPIIGRVQARLKQLGYYNSKIDNDFGSGTFYALRDFQNDKGLVCDGEFMVDGQTWKALSL